MKSSTITRSRAVQFQVAAAVLLAALMAQSVFAQTTIARWANPSAVSQSNLSSTNGNALIYVPSNPYQVGDLIYFNGTTATANPFGTTANRYYVIFSSGNNIKVATTYNGAAVNAVNSITGTGTAQQHPDWLTGVNWTGGTPPNDNGSYASFPGAGGGTTPGGGIVINGNVTVYGLGWVNLSQDLAIFSGSSNSASLYPLTFATSDGTTPKITCTNATGGVIFLGHNSQAASLKINGTQGLILNAGPGGAITGSGTSATSSGPSKDIRVYNTVNWADFSGGIQIERGQVSQQNGASTLPTTQNLTVGNNQTIANSLLAALSLNAKDCTVGALNGVSLGRIYNGSGTSIFTVGNNNSNGVYAGSMGFNFDGSIPNANLWFHKAGTGTQTISGPITGTNTTVTVDAGTLILTGNNTYKGVTTVNAGKLVVSSAQQTTNNVIVANGATLDVNVSGTSQLPPGTLTFNSTATTLEFLGLASTTTAPIKPGTLAVNGVVTVNVPSGTLAPGNSYPLINWTSISGTGSFVLGTCPFTASLSTNGSTLTLNITAGTNVWTGLNNGNWDTTTTGNWLVNGAAGTYVDASLTVFDDTATGTTNVTLNQLVKPGAVAVNNSLLGYSITSASGNYIGGAGSLTKSGSGILTLDGPNTYSGGTTLSAGQLNINYGGSNSTNSAIGTGALTIGGGTLDNTSAGDVTMAPAIAQSWTGDFSYAGSAHALNLGSGAVTLSANRIVTVTNNTLAIGGSIGDGGSSYTLTKNGGGTLALLGASTFAGGFTLNAGTVKVGDPAALGSGTSQLGAGTLDLNGIALATANTINNSTLLLTNSSASAAALTANSTINSDFTIGVGAGNISVARLIASATRTVTKQGAGTLTFNGAGHNNQMAVVMNGGTLICGNVGGYSADRGFTLNGGTVKLAGSGSGGSYPNANLINDVQTFAVNGGTFDLNGWNETVGVVNGANGFILNNASNAMIAIGSDNGSATFSGSFLNGTGTLAVMKVGTGTQTLAGTNTYTGGTIVSNGILQAGAANVFSTNGGDMTLLIGSVIGVLDLNGFDNAINGLNGGGTIDTVAGGTPTLTLGVNGTNGNFTGTIQNSSGTLSLLKVGAGIQVLSGVNNYSGTTVISNGTLVAGNSLNGPGAVTVYGPGTLNASNYVSVGGPVTLANSGARISLLDNAINSLSLNGGLTLASGSVLKFDISNAGVDSIATTGGFSQTGTATININQLSAPNAGTYTLISSATGISSANFTLGNTLSGYSLSLSSDGSNLYLNVVLNAPASAYWHNRVGTAWNGNSGANYNWDTDQSSGTVVATFPAAASDVYFAADAASSYATTLGADFGIKSLTFNTANNVTIAGTNVLTVGGPITVNSGAGSNVISATNVVLGVDQNISIADTGNTLTINSPISGAHAFNVSGAGTVALSGSSSFSGGTTISSGTLALKNATNTLPDTGAISISGGTLSIGTNSDIVGAVTLSSGAITGSSGVLKGSSYNLQNGTVSADLGGTNAVTVNGGLVLMAGNSTYSGGTTLATGTLQVGATNGLGSGSVSVANGTYLDLNGQTIPNVAVYAGGATLANNAAAAAAITADGTVNGNITIDTTGGNIATARLIASSPRTVLKTGVNTLTFNGAGHNNQVKLQVQGGTVVCANNGGYSADRGFELDYGTVKLAGPGSGGSYPNANLFNDGQQFWLLDNGAGTSFFDLNGWNETVATVYGTSGATILNNATGTNSTLTVGADNATGVNTFSGTIQDGSGVVSIAKTGTGVQIFNGTSTYSGNSTINNGQLQVTASGASPNSTYVINTNGGLTFDTDTAFVLGSLSGSGNLALLNIGSSPITLTVGGNNSSTTYSGVLSDSSLGAPLTKTGTGALTLLGANTYSGLTTVSNGTLIISSNYVAGGNVTVNEGAVLGVTGNSLTTSAQVGTLTFGISGSGRSTMLFKSLPAPGNAPITVSTITPAGSTGSIVISNNAVLSVGTYNLINYTNLGGVGFSAFTLGALPPGTVASLFNNTAASPKVIQLVVSAIAPQVWSGAVNTNWDIAATANWKVNSVATNYADFSPVLFDDTATGSTTVNIATNVQPSSVVVSNVTKSYTFTTANSSGITGATSLTKNGSGTLTLANVTNSFTGGVSINNGTLVLASANLGSNNIANNANLVFSNAAQQVVPTAIFGTGAVVQNGAGILELSGANSFSGGLIVKNGTVQTDNTNALGTGTVTLGDGVSANNATLLAPSLVATFGNTNPVVVAAGGTGVYKIQFIGNPDYHLSGGILLNNALTLSVTASGALFIDGPITSGTGNPAITVDGGNSSTKFVYLTADNSATLTASFVVTNKGTLKSGHTNSLNAANAVAIDSSSWLDTGAKNLTIAGLNDFGATGGSVADSGSGTVLTLGGGGTYSFSGVINNTGGLLKNGSGTQTLSGANTYTGPTVVSNGTLVINGSLDGGSVTIGGGTLSGTGILHGATTVSGGALAPAGNGVIGTLAISNSLTLQAGGTLAMDINKTTGTNDLITGLTTVNYGGTLAVNNLSGSLTTTDSFKLFNAGTYGGAFVSITPATPASGLVWNTNTLTTDGVLRIATSVATNPTNITFAVSGNQLTLTWPGDHQGWILQAQTNTLSTGLATNWVDVPNSGTSTQAVINVDSSAPTVFFRLRSP